MVSVGTHNSYMLAMRSVRGTVLNQGLSDMDLFMQEDNIDKNGLPKLTSETLLNQDNPKAAEN